MDLMRREEVSAVAVGLAMVAMADLWVRLLHRLELCSCRCSLFWVHEPCAIGIQQMEDRKRAEFYARWDALGLGYVGPGRI